MDNHLTEKQRIAILNTLDWFNFTPKIRTVQIIISERNLPVEECSVSKTEADITLQQLSSLIEKYKKPY